MKTNTKPYDVIKSADRISKILESSSSNYKESTNIPDRCNLTYENGYYVNVGAIFVDIRESSNLTDEHYRPKLAKLYRSYISEVVAILNSFESCKEISIVGDCVSGIFEGQSKSQIQEMFDASVRITDMINILNYHLEKKQIIKIKVGVGLDYGRALVIQSGYSGSGVKDIVWMGDVVNSASNLCNRANKEDNKSILLGEKVYSKLVEEDKELLEYNEKESCYHGDIFFVKTNNWYRENCK